MRRTLPLGARHGLLTAHIVMSVGLLGDSAGYLVLAIRTSTGRLIAAAGYDVAALTLATALGVFKPRGAVFGARAGSGAEPSRRATCSPPPWLRALTLLGATLGNSAVPVPTSPLPEATSSGYRLAAREPISS